MSCHSQILNPPRMRCINISIFLLCWVFSHQAMVYEKALRLSTFSTSNDSMTVGEITNHMSTDASDVLDMFQTIHFMWSVPFKVCP